MVATLFRAASGIGHSFELVRRIPSDLKDTEYFDIHFISCLLVDNLGLLQAQRWISLFLCERRSPENRHSTRTAWDRVWLQYR